MPSCSCGAASSMQRMPLQRAINRECWCAAPGHAAGQRGSQQRTHPVALPRTLQEQLPPPLPVSRLCLLPHNRLLLFILGFISSHLEPLLAAVHIPPLLRESSVWRSTSDGSGEEPGKRRAVQSMHSSTAMYRVQSASPGVGCSGHRGRPSWLTAGHLQAAATAVSGGSGWEAHTPLHSGRCALEASFSASQPAHWRVGRAHTERALEAPQDVVAATTVLRYIYT